jgi:hypothetical protein
MCSHLIFYAVISLLLSTSALTIELLANYKYWRSAGEDLCYDYSGNSRHGRVNSGNGYNATERGLMPYNYYENNLMTYAFPSRSEYITSFWLLSHALAESRFSLFILYLGGYLEYGNRLNPTKTQTYYITSGDEFIYVPISGWNLHTIRFYMDPVTNGRVHITQFLNLDETPFYLLFMILGLLIFK